MKLLKTVGISLSILGGCAVCAKIHNDVQSELSNRQFFQESFIEKYAPEKYKQLKDVAVDDYKTWQKAYKEVEDSLAIASRASKTYFDASKNIADSVKTENTDNNL